MKKNLLRALCFAFVLTLCIPMVACDMQFGGLVGELLENMTLPAQDELLEEWSSDLYNNVEDILPEIQTAIGTGWDDYYTEIDTMYPPDEIPDYTDYPETTEPFYDEITTEPPIVIDPVTTFIAFDECAPVIGNQDGDLFFTPGQSATWNNVATVKDYNVEFIRVWGWVSFFSEKIGEFGYQIDDNDPVYDSAFAWETEQPVIDASLAMGGKTGSRMKIMVPVRDLSGEHTVKALVKDAAGTVEVITEFTLNKAVDPNAPVFFVPAADMASSIPGSPDIVDAVLSNDRSYVTVTTGQVGDPYYQMPMINKNKGYVAKYVVIKYRTLSDTIRGESFIGSGAGPCGQGDHIPYEMINDGRWHLAILDLSQAPAIVDGAINYLRLDFFAGGQDNVIDLAYVAAFNSEQAAIDYDAKLDYIYPDIYNVPQELWTVSGHFQGVYSIAGNTGNEAILYAAGIESGALLHQGYIGVGELDLSKYSKAIIYYGNDSSQVTIDNYKNNENNRIMLCKEDQAMTFSPTPDNVIAGSTYMPKGWQLVAIEIDLTDVDYSGPVYITYDTLPGNIMAVGKIEFVYNN